MMEDVIENKNFHRLPYVSKIHDPLILNPKWARSKK